MTGKERFKIVYVFVFLLSFFAFDRILFQLIKAEEKNLFKKEDLSAVFFRKNDFNKNFFNLPRGTYDTVVMGSSRTYRGIHPYYLYQYLDKKAFKIAGAKTRPKFNYHFYGLYKKFAGVPKLVIYGVDYFMFKHKTSDPFFRQFMANTGGKLFKDGLSLLIANKTQIDEILNQILELYSAGDRTVHARQNRRKKQEIPDYIDPFVGYEKRKPIDTRKPPRFETFEYRPYPGEEGFWFLKLLKELNRDGVSVALVILPSFIGTYESDFQRDTFLADIRQLARPFSNIFVLNYNHPDAFPMDNAGYFQDGGYGKTNSHLSARGARILNEMLARDLKAICPR